MPATPIVTEGHATEALRIGTVEEISALAKLTPVFLPNDALVTSLQARHPNDPRWRLFRNDPNYIFVINWLFQCRGYINLASEHFDTDLFEIELFELVNPPPVDEMTLLVNKVKLALISKVHGKKVQSLTMFESLFRVYFGSDTPLSGPSEDEEEEEEAEGDGVDSSTNISVHPSFDDLFIDEKLSILSILISEISQYPDFREYIEKNKISPDILRLSSFVKIATCNTFSREEYVLLFDATALYKRTVSVPELVIPKKRKLAPQYPHLHYPEEAFDVASVEYELVYKDIYGLDLFIKELFRNRKLWISKVILSVINTQQYVSNVFSYETCKRKIISGRKKEFEMARLLATRKRSSRIEAKERQKHLEELERKAQELEDLQYATTRRSQRAQNQQQKKLKMSYSEGLSRGERLNLRKEKVDEIFTLVNVDETKPESEEDIIALDSSSSPPILELAEPEELRDQSVEAGSVSSEKISDDLPSQSSRNKSDIPSSQGNSEASSDAIEEISGAFRSDGSESSDQIIDPK